MVKKLRLGERRRDLPKTIGLGCQESRLDIRFAQAVSSGECVLQTPVFGGTNIHLHTTQYLYMKVLPLIPSLGVRLDLSLVSWESECPLLGWPGSSKSPPVSAIHKHQAALLSTHPSQPNTRNTSCLEFSLTAPGPWNVFQRQTSIQ